MGGLAVQFVLTRSVRDSATLLDLLEGPNVGEPFVIARPTQPYLQAIDQASQPLRIGYLEHPTNGNRTAEPVARVLSGTAYLLQRMGHHVQPATFDLGVSWEAFTAAVGRYWIAYNAAFMKFLASATARSVDLTTVEPATLAMFHQGSALKAIDLIAAAEIRNQVTRAVGRFFTRYDVMLTPTLPDLPMPLGRLHAGVNDLDGLSWVARVLDSAPFSSLANMSGTPAISLPLGQDPVTVLPIGMQFGASFGKEDVLLRLAAELEQAAPWAERHPPIWAGSCSKHNT
jgi:amidase